jgi:hypothetical protein
MIKKITGWKDVDDNPFLSTIGKIFGIESGVNDSLDMSNYNKDKVDFDGKTKKSITEVIPGYLAKILSTLSGQKAQVFDYEKGSFRDISEVKSDWTSSVQRNEESGYKYMREVKNNLEAFQFENKDELYKLQDSIDSLYRSITRSGELIRPEKYMKGDIETDDLAEILGGSLNQNQIELIRAAIMATDKGKIYRDFGMGSFKSRASVEEFAKRESEKQDSIYRTIANGLFNDSQMTELTTKEMTEDDFVDKGKHSIFRPRDKYGKDSLYYLRKTFELLVKGIRVFVKDGEPDHLSSFESGIERYNDNLRQRSGEYNSTINPTITPLTEDKLKQAEELGQTVIRHRSDISSDPKVLADQIANYNRIKRENEENKEVKGEGFFSKLKDTLSKPFDAVSNMMKNVADKIDDVFYRVIFGKGIDGEDGEGFTIEGFINKTLDKITSSFTNFFNYLKEKVYEPLKEALIGEHGLVTYLKNSWLFKKAIEMKDKSFNFLFGEKGEGDKRSGGLFSDTANEMGDMFNKFKSYFTGKDKDGKDTGGESVFGHIKSFTSSFKDSIKEYLFGKDGENKDKAKGILNQFKESLLGGLQNFSEAIFGPKMIDGKENKNHWDSSDFFEKFKEGLPKVLAVGILGAGAGLLAGGKLGLLGALFLPGGPIGGAIVGTAIGFLSQSEKFKNFMFGDKDPDGKRLGGLISKGTQDFFKRHKTALIGGGFLGAVKSIAFPNLFSQIGVLPSMIVGGPIGGALAGVASSLMYKSDVVQNFLFGDVGKDGNRIGGLLDKIKGSMNKDTKNAAGTIAVGGLGGLGIGTILSKFGLFGSIAFNPMIGAIAGVVAAIGLTSDKWSEMLFGEDRLDKEGNHFKKGGLFNRFGNMMNVEVIQPFKVKMMEWNHNFIDWFHKNVADNVENAMIPILEEFSRIGGRISELFSKVGKFLTNLPIVNLFKGIGEDIVDSVYTNIIKPVGHVLSTILDQFKNAVGAVASMPFKMLRKFGDMLYEKHIKDGIAYYREMAWENLKKTPLVSGVIIPAMEGFKKGVDTVFDYTKSGLKKIFGFTTKMIGKGIGLLVKGVAGAIALPFQVIAAPFKAIGAIKDLGKNIRNTRDYSSKQSALDSIKAKNRGEEENTFLGAAWDMIKLMLPGNIGTKDAAGMSDEGGGYLYKRPHDDNKITITTPDGTEQPAIELPNGDIVPVIEDPNTGRQVPARFNDKGQLEKDPDTKLDLRSPKEKKNDKDAQRAEDKANRDDLLNKTKEEFDSQRKLAQSLGYDNLDDGKSFKGIEKEMKRKYGDDFKNKSQFEIDQHYIQLGMQQTQEKIKTAAEKTNTLLGRIIDCIMEMLFPGSTDIKPLGPPKPDELVKRDNAINDARLQNEAEEAKKLEELKKRGLYAKPIPGQPLQEYVNNDAVDFKLAMDMNEVEEEKKAKDKELKDARISKQRALSSKNVSWVKSEAEKKSTAEKELTWKDKILNTLSGAKDKISEHSTMWSEIFGKKGLITMGIMLALPLITNFLKNFKLPTAGDIINNITNSTKKFFNKIFNGADNDARTDKDGAGIANTDLHEVKWRAAYYGAEKAGDKALKGAKYVGGKIKATKAAAKNFRLSNVNRKLFSKLNKLQINNIDDMVNNHGVHMPEQVKELGIKNINELERLGVTSADDLAKIGINSYKDFEVLGIKPNAKDLSKLGIKDPDDLFKLVNPNAVVKPTLINKAKGAWNTTAARLQKGSDYTKGIRSYNKDLDAKAASIIDGLKSHGYDGKIKYNKKAGVVVAGSKQFDVGKRIKSQSDISDIKRNIKLKKSTVVDSEVKVGRKGIISKFIDLAKNTLGHMIEFIGKHFPNSSGLVSKLMKSTSSLLANLVESKLGKWTAKIVAGMGKTLGLAIPVAGLVINGAFVIWGGITGALEASRLFKIDPSSVDGLMRTISGIMKGVLNVGPAFVVEILNELSIEFLNKDVLSYIATQLYMLLANDVDDAKLQQAQSDMDVEVAAYNEEHGTNMSKDAYIDMTQKTVTQKVGDKFNEIGQGIFGKEKTVKNAQGVTVVARDAHGNIIRENQNIFQKGISAYGNLTKAVYGNWGSKQIYQTDENGVALMDEAGNYIQAKNTEGLTPEEIRKRYGMFAYADNDGNIRSKGKMNVIGEALGIAGDDEIRRRIGKTADQKVHMSDRVRNFAGNVFGNTLGRIVGVNSEQATQVMAGIQKVTGDLLNRIGSEITKAVTSMAQSLWEMPGKVIKNIAGLGEATVTYGEGKYCKVKEFPSVFIGGVVEAFSNLGKGISFLARSVKKGMDIAYAHEYDFGGFKFSLKGIGDGFNAFFSNIGEKIAGIFNFVGEIINKFWESDAGKTLKKAGEVVGAGVNNFKAGVNVISSGINNLTQGDQGVLENLRKTGSQFGSHVGGPGIGGPTMDLYDKKKSFNSARGWRMLNGKQNYHAGIDIGYGGVHPIIKSFTEGTVLGSTNEPAYGNHVVIRDKYGYGHLYGHLDSVNVKKGDTVGVGDVIGQGTQLCSGPVDVREILEVSGLEAAQRYLINSIQGVYESQGITIHDKHLEVIVKEMSGKIKIEDPGDTNFLFGQIITMAVFNAANKEIEAKKGKLAVGKRVLLGLIQSALSTGSWLSAASFQQTTSVLTEASLIAEVDNLIGLKENVIIGRLIPVSKHQNQ